MDNYKLTIIMSNYNQAQYIEKAIDSVLMQKTNFPWQLIITDDCSEKDNSIDIIKGYVKRYPDKIKALYNKSNGKYLVNILRAKAITKTPYFTLLDADDFWTDENYLQTAIDYLDQNTDVTIYARNVMCLEENGRQHPFLDIDIPNKKYSIDDFETEFQPCPQTTGSVFRNVIFIKGIPSIMQEAIGTIHERSFEGDVDRFFMHLKYGKAYFDNRISGTYRILTSGIWSGLNKFEKLITEAQSYIDYNEYYEYQKKEIFLTKAYQNLRRCISMLSDPDIVFNSSKNVVECFCNVFSICYQNKSYLQHIPLDNQKIKFKYRIYKKIFSILNKKLQRKGII